MRTAKEMSALQAGQHARNIVDYQERLESAFDKSALKAFSANMFFAIVDAPNDMPDKEAYEEAKKGFVTKLVNHDYHVEKLYGDTYEDGKIFYGWKIFWK